MKAQDPAVLLQGYKAMQGTLLGLDVLMVLSYISQKSPNANPNSFQKSMHIPIKSTFGATLWLIAADLSM